MQKVLHKHLFMLTLPGILLLTAFLIVGGIDALVPDSPSAQAADLSTAQSGQSQDECTHRGISFGNAVVINTHEIECGDMTSYGGNIFIHGQVRGDVVTFKGNVVIDGSIDGNITVYGGNLIFLNTAHINGDSHVCGGYWLKGENSQLHGSVINDCAKGVWTLLGNDGGVDYRFWSTLGWVVVGILLTTLLPEHVMLVRTTIQTKMRRSVAIGLLSILLAPIILAVLIALIVSIPLAILIGTALLAAWTLGTVAIGWFIGEHILHKLIPQQNARPMQVIIGMIIVALAESLPYVGLLVSISAGIVGLGAVLLSRYGTRLYIQPKQPLSL